MTEETEFVAGFRRSGVKISPKPHQTQWAQYLSGDASLGPRAGILHEIERVLEGRDASLRAEAGGIQCRGRLGEAYRGFGIEAAAEADGEAGIEGITAAAGAFDLDVEGRHRKMAALGVVVIGAVGAPREDAGPDAQIDEMPGIVSEA